MTQKSKPNPFATWWTIDVNASWKKSLKPFLSRVVETNGKLSKEMSAWNERTTTWTKNTLWGPLSKTLMTLVGKMIEETTSLARRARYLGRARDGPEPTTKS